MMSRLVDGFLRGPSEDGCEHQATSCNKPNPPVLAPEQALPKAAVARHVPGIPLLQLPLHHFRIIRGVLGLVGVMDQPEERGARDQGDAMHGDSLLPGGQRRLDAAGSRGPCARGCTAASRPGWMSK